MKVLIITSRADLKSGYGRVSFELVGALRKKNVEVVIICHEINEELKGVKQIPILPGPMSFKKSFFFSWFYILKLFKHKKEIKECNKIHCFVEVYSFFAFLLSKFFRKPYFLLAHGTYSVLFFKYKIFGFFQKIAYKFAAKIVCVSHYTKRKILSHVKLNNLIVVPNGISLENFNSGGLEKENILMSIGAFKKRKGFKLLVEALSIVLKEVPNAKFYIGGGVDSGGNYYDELTQLADSLGLKDRIEFFKNVSDEYIKKLYKKSKVFALTLISDDYNFDGFGLVYLEANACGLPVVGTRGSGAEEAIKDGFSGFLAKENDVKDIADKIISLFKDEVLYEKMSKNAILWAKEHSWDKIVNKYIEIYIN